MKPSTAEKTITEVTEAYDAVAEHFSNTRSNQWKMVEHLLDEYVHSGDSIADIGCGNGRVSELCDARGILYTGSDISVGLLTQARNAHPQHTFMLSTMEHLPFADNSFDHLILVASFHHIPSSTKRIAVLNELKRIVRPGGTIMMTNWNLYQFKYWRLHVDGFARWLFAKEDSDMGDVRVPWKSQEGATKAERYYHSFLPMELRYLLVQSGLQYVEQYYELHGEHVPFWRGQNIVTVARKSAKK